MRSPESCAAAELNRSIVAAAKGGISISDLPVQFRFASPAEPIEM
jgi:hypothetical protein